jgi:hypothetical protein
VRIEDENNSAPLALRKHTDGARKNFRKMKKALGRALFNGSRRKF